MSESPLLIVPVDSVLEEADKEDLDNKLNLNLSPKLNLNLSPKKHPNQENELDGRFINTIK